MKIAMGVLANLMAAAAIVTAPIAAAEPTSSSSTAQSPPSQQSCVGLGGSQFKCQSPGNVQIDDAPPVSNYFPLGTG
jgi:hypothetical protein